MWSTLATRSIELIGPLVAADRCGACDVRLSRRALLCSACAATVERWHGNGDPIAFGLYGGALAQVLLRIKYGRRPDLGQPVGELLAGAADAHGLGRVGLDVVVPVPVPRSRLRERGYNQAALIGRWVARGLQAPMACMALARAEGGSKQAALGRRERLRNLQGAFWVRESRWVSGARVLLVDDVSTTGATVQACTEQLLAAGARVVRSIVVARTDAFAMECGQADVLG